MDDAMDCLISVPDFLYAFQVQFCFDGEHYHALVLFDLADIV